MTATSTVIERKARATESRVMPAGESHAEAQTQAASTQAASTQLAPTALAGARAVAAPGALARLADHGLEVPVLGGGTVPHTNLDLAASAPPLASVAAHVAGITPWYSSVHRGTGYASELATALVEDAREAVARHVGARDGDVVVFTRNTTDALNLLASAVPGDVGGGGRAPPPARRGGGAAPPGGGAPAARGGGGRPAPPPPRA
ncbi:aminotransferase class V-fold PLP-dependent enzyme, partial [Agromyces soli]